MSVAPYPEITAIHVLAALSETAPAGVVIAIDTDHMVVVAPASTLRHWRGHWQATIVATRPEIAVALPPAQRRDLEVIDAYATRLTDHAAGLLSPAPAAA